jgi:hypothetical protein
MVTPLSLFQHFAPHPFKTKQNYSFSIVLVTRPSTNTIRFHVSVRLCCFFCQPSELKANLRTKQQQSEGSYLAHLFN